jgi:hypothetical protein
MYADRAICRRTVQSLSSEWRDRVLIYSPDRVVVLHDFFVNQTICLHIEFHGAALQWQLFRLVKDVNSLVEPPFILLAFRAQWKTYRPSYRGRTRRQLKPYKFGRLTSQWRSVVHTLTEDGDALVNSDVMSGSMTKSLNPGQWLDATGYFRATPPFLDAVYWLA